jgi:restriction endonuclease S subunit
VSEVLENAAASWPEVFVSDVSELIRGVTYSKEHATDKPQDGYTPVLRATNIQESRLVLESDLVFVPDSNVSANQRLRAGDIVVATSSGSKHLVGKSGLVHADWRGSFGAFCAAIRPKANIESRFLAAFLQSPSYWKQVGKKALGVNINNLRRGDIESLTLPLPRIGEAARNRRRTRKTVLPPRRSRRQPPARQSQPQTLQSLACLVRATRHRLMVCDTVYRFRCDESKVQPEYLEIALNAPKVVDAIDRHKAGISESGVSLTHDKLGSVLIPLPSREAQAAIVAEVDRHLSIIREVEAEVDANLQRAQALRQSTLAKAFSS